MRVAPLVVCAAVGCTPAPQSGSYYGPPTYESPMVAAPASYDLTQAGVTVDRIYDFAFDGCRIEFEMRREDDRVIEVARNHYMVPLVIQWQLDNLDNLSPLEPPQGVAVLPAANEPNGQGTPVVLTTMRIM